MGQQMAGRSAEGGPMVLPTARGYQGDQAGRAGPEGQRGSGYVAG
jgi:hypothetical protein